MEIVKQTSDFMVLEERLRSKKIILVYILAIAFILFLDHRVGLIISIILSILFVLYLYFTGSTIVATVTIDKKTGLITCALPDLSLSKPKLTININEINAVRADIRYFRSYKRQQNKSIILICQDGNEIVLNQLSLGYMLFFHAFATPTEVKVGKAIAEFLAVPFEESFAWF